VIKWAQFLQCPPLKICDGKKVVHNFLPFLTTFHFDREYLRKESTYQKQEKLLSTTLPTLGVKSWRNLGVFPLELIRHVGVCRERNGYANQP